MRPEKQKNTEFDAQKPEFPRISRKSTLQHSSFLLVPGVPI
jgi:hypothetical protein